MEIYQIKSTKEPVLMIFKSHNIQGIVNTKTGECTYIKSLNLVMNEEGKKIAIGDSEIEFLEELDDE